MTRLIDADVLMPDARYKGHNDFISAYDIANAPTVDAEPVRQGRWIYHESIDIFECSVCGSQMVRNIFNFCPWCGARMEVE